MSNWKQTVQICCLLATIVGHCTAFKQPVVDLGYEIYQATEPTNETVDYYNFPNIRYASPPVGDLRWKAPVSPQRNRSAIQSNPQSITCPQGSPTWQIRTANHTNEYLQTGKLPNVSYSRLSAFVSGGEEDCLFLDVSTPRKTFTAARTNRALAPVLVWIHGGGFTSGSKTSFGSARGLLSRSLADGSNGVVYVALNYRIGGFGFMSGPSFEAQGGLPNAGLHDQRFALEWIQRNIHLFGGDKDQVTVLGESGGGGSIMHHLTAFGGSVPALFNRAVAQSPAYFPYRSEEQQNESLGVFLGAANVSTLEDAQNLPADTLVAANVQSIGQSLPYASSIYGPQIDGSFVQTDPKVSLRRGEFDQSVKMVVAHNSYEGLVLVPVVQTDGDYVSLLKNILTTANSTTIEYIANALYPPVFDGSMGYVDNYQRAARTAGDAIINCNAAVLGAAYQQDSYGYYFDVYPGIHAQDLGYTFYNPGYNVSSYSLVETDAVNRTIALTIQDYITSLAKSGFPGSAFDGLSSFPALGHHAMAVSLNSSRVGLIHDPAVNERCKCIYGLSASLEQHTSAVSVLALTPDEKSLLSGSWDKRVFDWDLNTGRVRRAFGSSAGQISTIEVRPESSLSIPRDTTEVLQTNGTFLVGYNMRRRN